MVVDVNQGSLPSRDSRKKVCAVELSDEDYAVGYAEIVFVNAMLLLCAIGAVSDWMHF